MTTSGSSGDGSRALAPGVVLFGIMAAHAVLETARDSLFLTRLGPGRLAWAYLAIAATALAAVGAVRRWGGPRDPRRVLISFLTLGTLGTSVLAATITLVPAIAPSLVFVLYVWIGLVATLVVPSFWTVLDRSLQIAEAKRLFAVIGAGGVLGALVGSATSAILARHLAAHHLVSAGATMFALTTAAAIALAPRPLSDLVPRVARPPHARAQETRSRTSQQYLRLLLVLGIVSMLTLTLGDLMFKRILAERFAADELASAFGVIYTGLNVIGLVIQVAVTPRLLERLGVGGALTVLPVIMLASALGFLVTGAAIAILALKLSDGGLRHSVHRVGSEILFMPLAAAVRDASKPAVDVIGQRGGQILAALLTFAVATDASGTWMLGLMTAAAGGTWLVAIAITRNAYAQQFRDTLEVGELELAREVRRPAPGVTSIEGEVG